MTTEHIKIRVDEKIKLRAEKASALLGFKSLNEYVGSLMDKDATQVIRENENIQIQDSRFDEFMAACDKVTAPNQALIDAVKFTYESDIE